MWFGYPYVYTNRNIKSDSNNHYYPATRTYLTTFHLNINPPCFYPNGYSGVVDVLFRSI